MSDNVKKPRDNKDEAVDLLRQKSEDVNLDSYLKSSFGGYTKKSVKEYLSVLRKNQQKMTDTFNKNHQDLFEEKEKLRKNYEVLQGRLAKVQMEYKNLFDSILMNKLDNSSYTHQDVLSLKDQIAALKDQLKASDNEKLALNRKLEQLNNNNDSLKKSLQQSREGIEAQKELYLAEKLEVKSLRDKIAELSVALEAERDDARYWKSLQSEGKNAELQYKVNELTEENRAQKEVISKQRTETELYLETMASLKEENALLNNEMGELKDRIDKLVVEKDKLALGQSSLREKLWEELDNKISLINERSSITIDKLLLEKKLQEVTGRVSALELELNKNNRLFEILPKELKKE